MRLCRRDELEQGHALLIQVLIARGAFFVCVKCLLRLFGISIAFPVSAARVILSLVADKSHHIAQRIAEKNADFVREIRPQAQSPRQLANNRLHAAGQVIAALPQKHADVFALHLPTNPIPAAHIN